MHLTQCGSCKMKYHDDIALPINVEFDIEECPTFERFKLSSHKTEETKGMRQHHNTFLVFQIGASIHNYGPGTVKFNKCGR